MRTIYRIQIFWTFAFVCHIPKLDLVELDVVLTIKNK
jgi:hypothetical protein